MSDLNFNLHLTILKDQYEQHQQEFLKDLQSRVGKMEAMKTFEMTDEQYQRVRTAQASINKAVSYEENVEAYIENLELYLASALAESAYWKENVKKLNRRIFRLGGYVTPKFPKQ